MDEVIDIFKFVESKCTEPKLSKIDKKRSLELSISPTSKIISSENDDQFSLDKEKTGSYLDHDFNADPAKVYPFTLDDFQKEAIYYIEKNESVLVAAHTSAGKTAVAEYAIAKAFKNHQRVIYTSPIKALSNQKYRDLQEEFTDVGLMTGDMTINPTATLLIMTTEILRSMLYRGSEIVREVAWVIYDEVHYMRDKERGVVWEESIILLPHKVRFVFLSATIPNAKEFVGWISKLHFQNCHVVYTDYRPVPLQHFLYPSGSDGLYLVVDEKGIFRDENFQKAMNFLQPEQFSNLELKSKKSNKKNSNSQNSDLSRILKLIIDRNLDPCIIFSFSKKECESFALQISRYDFTSNEEKGLIEQVFLNAIESLSEDDKFLPQIETILPLLKRGIGIHHGGLLPILKEVIEILFQESLIKCLFATETFSIGINMPARTVVFTSTRKFDGKDFRWITPGEYIQMSGRAGRRGKDDKGIVIQMIDEKIESETAKNILYGESDPLYSSYHVAYNMVLNMLRVDDSNPENLLKMSFHQFQHEAQIPNLETKAEQLSSEAQSISLENELFVENYFTITKKIEFYYDKIARKIHIPMHCFPFLQPGRLVLIKYSKDKVKWGTLLNISRNDNQIEVDDKINPNIYKIDTLLLDVVSNSTDTNFALSISSFPLSSLQNISAIRLNLPKQLTNDLDKKNIYKSLMEVVRRFGGEEHIPLLDPLIDMGINDEDFKRNLNKYSELNSKIKEMSRNPCFKQSEIDLYSKKFELIEESQKFRNLSRDSQIVLMKDDLKKMKRVLRRLEFITKDNLLELKGKFACEINTADELLLTELVFEGVFNNLDKTLVVALLSCFVSQENNRDSGTTLPIPELSDAFSKLQHIARKIAKIKNDAGISCDEEEYVRLFNPSLMVAVLNWSNGKSFVEVCKFSDIFEGSLIRSIRRLEELSRQLSSASFSIGNNDLKIKFEDGSNSIRRGIVFAPSLYL